MYEFPKTLTPAYDIVVLANAFEFDCPALAVDVLRKSCDTGYLAARVELGSLELAQHTDLGLYLVSMLLVLS